MRVSTLEGHRRWVYSVAWSHDSAALVSASHSDTVKMWDRTTGRCVLTLDSYRNPVCFVALSKLSMCAFQDALSGAHCRLGAELALPVLEANASGMRLEPNARD
ncbi:hypothetical protein HD806DRAFT_547742 [Xylariaceae sp. AK1471]|nr:hypothetical protein HD806DRAFT_547742 [Xylariaceae sp. AK1471]